MKKRYIKYIGNIVFATLIIVNSGCSKKDLPAKNVKPEMTEKEKSEEIQNFNYLFIEALKQKIFGDYRKALKYFLECEKIKPDDAVEYQISGIYAISNLAEPAIKYGKMALEKDPDNIWYYYQLASEYQMFGKTNSLINIYERIVTRFPDIVKDKITLGDLYLQNKEPEKAVGVYKEIEKEYGKTLELEKKIIQVYAGNGHPKKALEEANLALSLFGEDKEILLMKAEVLEKTDQKAKAEEIYNNLLEKYKDDPEVNIAIYKKYMDDNEYEKAVAVLEKIIRSNEVSQNKKLDFVFEMIYLDDPVVNINNEEVGRLVQEVYKRNSEDLRTQLLVVDYYSRKQQFKKAKELLRNMIRQYPMFKIGWHQILYISEKMEMPDTVIHYAKEGMKIFKNDPLLYVYLCSAYIKKNDNEKVVRYAEDGITKVLQKGVDYVEKETGLDYKEMIIQLYGFLGEAYKNMGQYKKSDQAYEDGLKIDPENSYLLNNYSYYLSLRKEKLRKALQMSGKTLKEEPGRSTFLDTYGWILYQMGKLREAEKYIKKAMDNGGDESPDILEHYGDVLYKMGDLEGAVKYWEKAIKKGGNTGNLEKKIQTVQSE